MRRVINGILLLAALAGLAAAAAEQLGLIRLAAPPLAFAAAAGFSPSASRAPAAADDPPARAFSSHLVFLAGLTAGSPISSSSSNPHGKGILAAAFAPKPTAVSVEDGARREMAAAMPAIGNVRAFQGIDMRRRSPGVVSAIHFQSGDDVAGGRAARQPRRRSNRPISRTAWRNSSNAELSLDRQQQLVDRRQHAARRRSTRRSPRAIRPRRPSTHARAIIAQKTIAAPFAGRLGMRKVDIGQYVAVGTSLVDPPAARSDLCRFPDARRGD